MKFPSTLSHLSTADLVALLIEWLRTALAAWIASRDVGCEQPGSAGRGADGAAVACAAVADADGNAASGDADGNAAAGDADRSACTAAPRRSREADGRFAMSAAVSVGLPIRPVRAVVAAAAEQFHGWPNLHAGRLGCRLRSDTEDALRAAIFRLGGRPGIGLPILLRYRNLI